MSFCQWIFNKAAYEESTGLKSLEWLFRWLTLAATATVTACWDLLIALRTCQFWCCELIEILTLSFLSLQVMHATRVLLPVRLRWAAPLAGFLVSSGMVDTAESPVGITPFGSKLCLDLKSAQAGFR